MDRFESSLVEQIPRLRRYARALTGDPARADDLVQDCLARAVERRHLWIRARGMRAWLFTIMHNLYVNDVAREARSPRLAAVDPDMMPTGERADEAAMVGDVDRALAALPAEQREVVLLVGLEGFTYREAAAAVGVPIGTVMSRLARGRDRLRVLLHDRGAAGEVRKIR